MLDKKYNAIFLIIMFFCFLTAGCSDSPVSEMSEPKEEISNTNDQNKYEKTIDEDLVKADKIVAEMTLDKKIYQMLFVTPESLTNFGHVFQAGETTKVALEKYPVGGLIYFAANIQNREQTKAMISNSQKYSEIPLFIGVDEEGGRVARISSNPQMNITPIPPMLEIGKQNDANKAYFIGQTLGNELKELGFNVDFAPVADLLINEQNTEIGDRSFGNEPGKVSELVRNIVIGLQENNVSAVLKHFPGHGSATSDSHTGYAESNRTIDEMRQNEFIPFEAGIEAGADFVLVSHLTLSNAGIEKLPASLSKEIINDYLINELGFEGVIITDSFSMGAITENFSLEEAVIKAINAGVDIILMPQSLVQAHDVLVAEVKNGNLSEERIDTSVKKIILLKIKRGLL